MLSFKQFQQGLLQEGVECKLVDEINEIRASLVDKLIDKKSRKFIKKLDREQRFNTIKQVQAIIDKMPIGTVLIQNTDAGDERYTKVSDEQYGWERLRQPFKDVREQSSFDIAQWLIAPAWVNRGPIKFKMQ